MTCSVSPQNTQHGERPRHISYLPHARPFAYFAICCAHVEGCHSSWGFCMVTCVSRHTLTMYVAYAVDRGSVELEEHDVLPLWALAAHLQMSELMALCEVRTVIPIGLAVVVLHKSSTNH